MTLNDYQTLVNHPRPEGRGFVEPCASEQRLAPET